jgi:hypothetical protein
VAVGAHDFTFGDSPQYPGHRQEMTGHVCHRSLLSRPVQMVKLKHPGWISLPAIRTGLPLLSFLDGFSDKLRAGSIRPLGLLDVLLLVRSIVLPAVGCLARNTIGVPAFSFCVESLQRFHRLTSGATSFVHALMVSDQLPKVHCAWEAGIQPLNYARTFLHEQSLRETGMSRYSSSCLSIRVFHLHWAKLV